ncbi:hypothetical protein ACFL5V_10400 [Fibrobacterota bacterium]
MDKKNETEKQLAEITYGNKDFISDFSHKLGAVGPECFFHHQIKPSQVSAGTACGEEDVFQSQIEALQRRKKKSGREAFRKRSAFFTIREKSKRLPAGQVQK